jgi:hypothetical protein
MKIKWEKGEVFQFELEKKEHKHYYIFYNHKICWLNEQMFELFL